MCRDVSPISPFERVSTHHNLTTTNAHLTISDIPSFCSAKYVNEYLESYVEYFDLGPHLRLSTEVKHVTHEDESDEWRLDFEDAPSEYFDKVIIATGPHLNPVMPTIEGAGLFEGRIMHSKAFKRYVDE